MGKKLTTEEFIEKARKVHGDKYDYSKSVYVGTYKKLIITCPQHGDFYMKPNTHLNGCGCKKCCSETTEEFIEEARKIHGDKYDYSKVEYVNRDTPICIICPVHGEYYQKPRFHINRRVGCQKCSWEHKSHNMTLTTEEFIERAKKAHGDKYDYSKVEYKSTKEKVCIICPEHGEFWQTPHIHIRGSECPKCVNLYRLTTNEFVNKAMEIHGDKYDYSKVNYVGNHKSVIITCKEHGDFKQLPQNHLRGCGCPKCSIKKNVSEKKLYNCLLTIFDASDIKVHYRDKNIWGFKSIDFYIPKYKIAIEHQGKQHFFPVAFGKKNCNRLSDVEKQQTRDKLKLDESIKSNINLIYFSYDKSVPDTYLCNKVYKDEKTLLENIKNIIQKQNDYNN